MKKRGFTLIELLIVIAIIGILATIVVINYSGAQRTAKYSKAKSDLLSIQSAAKMLAADTKENIFHFKLNGSPGGTPYSNGNYEVPIVADNELYVIGSSGGNMVGDLSKHLGLLETDGEYTNWAGPYIDQIPTEDPWGRHYTFDPDYVCSGVWKNSAWEKNPIEAEFEYGCEGVLNTSSNPDIPLQIKAIMSYGVAWGSGSGYANRGTEYIGAYYGEDNVAYKIF